MKTIAQKCHLILIGFIVSISTNGQPSSFVDPNSLMSNFIVTRHDTSNISTATSFIIEKDSATQYLITNNHVLGGLYFINEYKRDHHDSIPPEKWIPNNVIVRILTSPTTYNTVILRLFDNAGNPLFVNIYEKQKSKEGLLDISAIPLTGINKLNFIALSFNRNSINKSLQFYPSHDLYVVGFPMDWGMNNFYPIWKRGTIASEPEIPTPSYFIDATTRKGMSGSPVFFRGNTYLTKGAGMISGNGVMTWLAGIYSAQSFLLELGLVTKIQYIFDALNIPTN